MFKNSGYFNKIFYFLSVFLLVFFVANPVLAFIERVSVDSSSDQVLSNSFNSSVSDDGRYIAFESDDSGLVSLDINGVTDIFVHDRQTGTTERVSVDSLGVEGNAASYSSRISGDGRYVVFLSDSDNLVVGDSNTFTDVFVHDRQTDSTERVSVDSLGAEATLGVMNSPFYGRRPDISIDGRYVVFQSESDDLVAGDINGTFDVFVHDRQTDVTERVSVDSLGNESNDFSTNDTTEEHQISISGDGRYVVFASLASNLVGGDADGINDIFVHDRQLDTTEIISVDSLGNQGNANSFSPSISNDGRYVAFKSISTNLVSSDTNVRPDIFVHDLQTGSTERVSVDSSGSEGDQNSFSPSISGDGRYVAFRSNSTNLVSGDGNADYDVFVHDIQTGETEIVSVNSLGDEGDNNSITPSISRNGQYVVFESLATNLVAGDTNGVSDIFFFDFNDPPTTITLDPSNIYENLPIGTVVGTLDATDPNTSDVLTYALTCDSPEGGDISFEIVGDEVRTLEVFDYETQPLFDICVRVSDGNGGESQEVLTIFVLDAVPTDITLSNNSLNENNLVGANIGTLSTTISEAGSTFTYSFSCGVPGADDSSFSISGDSLNTLVSFDYETKSSYQICIESQDDATAEAFSKNFTINVLDVNEGGGSSGGSGSNPNPVLGCTDSDATNYNSSANRDDGSCIYTPGAILGCTDQTAGNYSAIATVDNGSCLYGVFGCMDASALNHNQLAVHSDNSCQYSPVVDPGENNPIYGCMEVSATNYNPSANRDDGSCNFLIPVVYGCKDINAENYSVYVTQDDGSCIYTNFIPENPDGGGDPENPGVNIPITGIINEIPEDLLKSVAVAGIIIPSFLISLLQPGLIAGAISVPLRIWNVIPVLMGYRRKKRPWGTVYDSVTKQPLDPVYVTIKSAYGQEVSTSITDMDGRFGFLVPAGKYLISANKANYIFPSVKLAGKEKDELYENLYFGGEIEVKEKEDVVFKNIPMDAINFNWNEFEKAQNKKLMKFYSKRDLFFARISSILFISGFISSIILFFLNNSILNSVILGLYLVIVALRFFGIKPRQSGRVTDKEGYPLSFAVLKLFSAELGREVAHSVVGKTGRYYMLVPNGQYYMKVSKKTGEDSYEEIYMSQSIKIDSGYVRENIVV